jgi:DNA polymerase bacteriophage-type
MLDLDPVRDWLVLDVETASFLDLRAVTADVYAEHPSTHVYLAMMAVHCVGAGSSPEGAVDAWRPGARLPAHLASFIRAGGRVVCWNAGFERAIHRHILGPRYGWPDIDKSQWRDAQANSVASALPAKLSHAMLAIGSDGLTKDREGNRLMRQMTVTEPLPGGGWRRPHETPENIARLERYCAMDVITTAVAYYRLPALTTTEHLVWQCDQDINERGVYLDTGRARSMSQLAAKREQQLTERVTELTGGELTSVKGHPAFRRWLHSRGLIDAGESVNKVAVEKLLARDDLPEDVREVCEIRTETGKLTSLAKLKRLPDVLSSDGRARGLFAYHAAHTGRWSSRVLQLHNLRKDRRPRAVQELCGMAIDSCDLESLDAVWSPLDALSQSLRSLVCAPPGHDLISADYSAIEARVLPWLAGDEAKLGLFRQGVDIYVRAAQNIGSTNRQLGKVQELALGYGMGALKFAATAEAWGSPLGLKEARRIQRAWRDANKPVVDFWFLLEAAVRGAVEHGYGSCGRVGKLTVRHTGSAVTIQLPSGRHLWYHAPRIELSEKVVPVVREDGRVETKTFEVPAIKFMSAGAAGMREEETYGGKLAENVTQAVARDCLAHALLTLRDTIYQPILHVHDSIAAEVPTGAGDVGQFERLICDLPAWAAGLPLVAEGYRGQRFQG